MTKCDTVVGLAFLDNFDEIVAEIDEARIPLLVAQIDSVLAQFARDFDGIVKKYENDKFLLVFARKKLADVRRDKLSVLTRVREIETGGVNPVTVSLGLGAGGGTVAENMDEARTAVDIALGRGGDQAIIKEGREFAFFGGVAREFSVNARTRARLKASAFAVLMRESEDVLVLGHKNADLDCVGAAVGVYKIAAAMEKPARIAISQMTTNVRRLYERLMKDHNYATVFIDPLEAAAKVTDKTLVVIVDTFRPVLVNGAEALEAAYRVGAKVVVIDHHRMTTDCIEHTVLTYHEPYASSTCELVTEVMECLRLNVKLKPVEADALLAGITVDTKNFSIKTGARTFETAAYLRKSGADGVRVKLLFQSDFASFRARAAAVGGAEVIFDNIAISVSQTHVENPQIVAAQAADELLNIDGIEASFVLCYWDGAITISARSLSAINVQLIMEKLGGGGHQTVAGAQLRDKAYDDLNEVEDALKQAIYEYMREGR